MKRGGKLFALVIVIVLACEAAIRLFFSLAPDTSTWKFILFPGSVLNKYVVKAEHPFKVDKELGWLPKPGKFKQVWKVDKKMYRATYTINQNGSRFNGSANPYTRKEVAVIGDSISMGYGVEDNECYSARLAQQLNSIRVTNLAAAGYSTYQALLRLQRFYEGRRKPSTIVYGLLNHHQRRNVLTYDYELARRITGICQLSVPFVEPTPNGLRHKKSVPFLCQRFDTWLKNPLKVISAPVFYHKIKNDPRITKATEATQELLLELKKTASQFKSRLIILDINSDANHFATFLSENQFNVVEVTKPYKMLPYDPLHPGTAFHNDAAHKLLAAIR